MHSNVPPVNPGFQRLVDIVTVNGALDPTVMVCEPRARQANDPGCKYVEPPRRSWFGTLKAWAGAQWDFIVEAFSDGD